MKLYRTLIRRINKPITENDADNLDIKDRMNLKTIEKL